MTCNIGVANFECMWCTNWHGVCPRVWDIYKYKNMHKITWILENVVRCKYFEAGVHIKKSIKNSYQDGLGRTTQTFDHVVVVHVVIWDKIKSQINEYSDMCHSIHLHILLAHYKLA